MDPKAGRKNKPMSKSENIDKVAHAMKSPQSCSSRQKTLSRSILPTTEREGRLNRGKRAIESYESCGKGDL